MELDYQLGEDIKEKLIPRAVDWFTGEALQYEEMDEDMEEGDYDDEDEEEDDMSDDHDDDEDSEEDVSLTTLGGFVTSANFNQDGASKPKQEAAECKQS